MHSLIQKVLPIFISLLILAAIGLALAYFVSGGELLYRVQTFYRRLTFREQQPALEQPFGSDSSPIRFEIARGRSASDIAAALHAAQLIRDPQLFIDYAWLEGYDRQFEAGVYFLNQTQTIPEIARALTDSSSSFILFRSWEGTRLEELAALIDANGLFAFSGAEFSALVAAGAPLPADFAAWAGIPAGASLEGFMFPDTYQLPPSISPQELRQLLLDTFRERVGSAQHAAAQAQGYSLYEMVALASIIEREAVWRDEHPQISSVYRNRLRQGMRLEADPTVQYGLQGARGTWWPQITRADYYAVDSPYNTYLHFGLPPGPIASPGLSAIQAAIAPAETPYFYFRAKCDNSHYHNFAITFDEHVANGC